MPITTMTTTITTTITTIAVVVVIAFGSLHFTLLVE